MAAIMGVEDDSGIDTAAWRRNRGAELPMTERNLLGALDEARAQRDAALRELAEWKAACTWDVEFIAYVRELLRNEEPQ